MCKINTPAGDEVEERILAADFDAQKVKNAGILVLVALPRRLLRVDKLKIIGTIKAIRLLKLTGSALPRPEVSAFSETLHVPMKSCLKRDRITYSLLSGR